MSRIRTLILLIGLFFLLLSFGFGIAGYIEKYCGPYFVEPITLFLDLYSANLATEFFSLAITVLVVDVVFNWRNVEREKRDFIVRLGSLENSFAKQAARLIEDRNWHKDGTLHGAKLHEADLSGSVMCEFDMNGAVIRGAELIGVDFKDAKLQNVDFFDSDLTEADFTNALLDGADFTEAILNGADFTGSNVTLEQLGRAESLDGTILPDGTIFGT